MTWQTLPNRRAKPRPDPMLRIFDERRGYLNETARDALQQNGEPCAKVCFQVDDLRRISIVPAATDDPEGYTVGRKGAVNVGRVTERVPGASFPVTLRLTRAGEERRLIIGGPVT